MNLKKIIIALSASLIVIGASLLSMILIFNKSMPITTGSLIYFALAMVLLGLSAALLVRMGLFNNQIAALFLVFCSFILTAAIIESVFYFMILKEDNNTRISARFEPEPNFPRTTFYIHDTEVGYWARPNSSTVYRTAEYSSTFSTDAYGRRISTDRGNNPSIILFGDSYTFGDGLEDNETLAEFLSEDTGLNVYNYAFQGYGTQEMLAHLERKGFRDEIRQPPVAAIYVYISDHVKRAIGDMRTYDEWGNDMPYYYLSGGILKRGGSFETDRPFTSSIYRILGKSYLFKYYYLEIPPVKKSDVYLTYKMIEKSRDIYESEFNSTFYVLIHPSQDVGKWDTSYLIELLDEAKIPVLIYDIPYDDKLYYDDGHPKSALNAMLAWQISSTIARQKP